MSRPIGFRAYNESDEGEITNDGKATVYNNLFVQNLYDKPEGVLVGQLGRGKVNIYEERDFVDGFEETWVRCDHGWIKKEFLEF